LYFVALPKSYLDVNGFSRGTYLLSKAGNRLVVVTTLSTTLQPDLKNLQAFFRPTEHTQYKASY
jgi:hypothetical protein